tara:strand:+ start:967 stop:1434 length:468 start_codon:yes stop_codon:yes gene_type:complete
MISKITTEPIDQVGLHDMEPDWSDHIKNKSPLQMVTQFAKAMGQPINQKWLGSFKLEELRFDFIKEEFTEFEEECLKGDTPENALKELADIVYVAYGYAATYGWDLDEAVRRVHKSNMSKLGVDGKPIKDPNGKVLKGPNYKKPTLQDLVETNNE